MNNPFENLDKRLSNIENLLLDIKHEPQHKLESDNPLGIKEASIIIGKSLPTIYNYCRNNEIPYSKQGHRLYFFKSELIEWLKTGKQKTLKELEADTDDYLSNKKKGLK